MADIISLEEKLQNRRNIFAEATAMTDRLMIGLMDEVDFLFSKSLRKELSDADARKMDSVIDIINTNAPSGNLWIAMMIISSVAANYRNTET
jgi:hypothetical protein